MLAAGGLIDACTQAASGVLTPTHAQAVLNQQLMYVIGILLVGGVASGLRAYMFNAAAERVMCRLRVQLFSKVRFDGTVGLRGVACCNIACYTCIWDQGCACDCLGHESGIAKWSGKLCHAHLLVSIYDLLDTANH